MSIDEVVLNFNAGGLMVLNGILAVVIFSIALDLRMRDFAMVLSAPRAVLAGVVAQFIALPALTFLLVIAVEPRPSIAMGLMLVAACPGGNISNFITHRAGGNVALSVSMTAVATVGAILLTPFNIAFWANMYGPTRAILVDIRVDPVTVAITVFFMLALPLALGVWLAHARPAVAKRIRRAMQYLSMVIFIGFIVIAVMANWAFFLEFAGDVALLVLCHNALALGAGNVVARVAGLSPFDRRAVTIETGIQNSGLGLVLIFTFFGGLGGMAVAAAFWGIWHAISGLALAQVWSRYEVAP